MIELWQHIDCPLQCINADGGLPHRSGQDGTQRYFSDSKQVLTEDAGHWTFHDQAAAVVAHTKPFLARRAKAKGRPPIA
jgi:pimeloyl-ACP methyl ester carboxylesterase